MGAIQQYLELKKDGCTNYWASRILSQIGYLIKTFEVAEEVLPADLCEVITYVYDCFEQEGTISKGVSKQAEQRLIHYSKKAKEYQVICAGHAHIDMNWMWGFQETVSVVIDTFQTMLDLMKEYKEFTFSQSQASTYRIIEKYCPSMLPEIIERVSEGRWEVTASAWVEPDKNMSGTESMARHILYTKKYLSGLLGISEESMELDFEPDTFGHSACVPEVLNQGGVKYYYHCRGFETYSLYRWRAPSGAEVIVYREPNWYLGPIEYDMMLDVPNVCRDNHTDTVLKVYGVGDHGGGPTRRDIERMMDMSTWPLMPDIKFGTMHEFFHKIEKDKGRFPVVDHELNYVLTGCYTTQSRIKLANRLGEDILYDAETLSTLANQLTKDSALSLRFEDAWERVLFNQFHDILPGSGVAETREYAMGVFQEALAFGAANANRAMKKIGDNIDTSIFAGEKDMLSISEGAGVGFGIGQTGIRFDHAASEQFGFTQTHRGNGDTRVYTLFNTTQYKRKEVVEITLWDWQYQEEEISIIDEAGKEIALEITERGQHYWQHEFIKLVIEAEIPSIGYATYCVKRKLRETESLPVRTDPRVHTMEDGPITLENEKVKAVFDSVTMKLIRLEEKENQTIVVDEQNPSAYFRYVEEDDVNQMTAWIVGGYSKIVDLNEAAFVKVTEKHLTGIRKWVIYEMSYSKFSVMVKISLSGNDTMLRYALKVDWQEIGKPNDKIPQLQFYAPFSYEETNYLYDIPAGCVNREGLGHDVPAVYYAAALPKESKAALMLTTDCKYGYRGNNQSMLIDLIRGSYDPDPYPDLGIHYINIGVGISNQYSWDVLLKEAILFSHPIYPYSNTVHTGTRSSRESFIQVSDGIKIASVKVAEENECIAGMKNEDCKDGMQRMERSWIIRLYHSNSEDTMTVLRFLETVKTVEFVDLTEKRTENGEEVCANGREVITTLPPFALRTLKISFEE